VVNPRMLFVAVAVSLALTACGPEEALDPATQQDALVARKFKRVDKPVGGQYLVTLSKDATADVDAMATSMARAHGGETLRVYRSALRGFAARLTEEQAMAMAKRSDVEMVEEDGIVSIDTVQSNPDWGLDRMDSRSLILNNSYIYNLTGAGVHAYILDTGIRQTHSEFTGRIGAGYDAVTSGGTAEDCHGHGTHVAGTVGGTTYGVAKGVILHPVRVLSCTGGGSLSGVIAGIDWVATNRISPAVANMSLGGNASATLDAAVSNAVAAGVTMVVAAGNSNGDACNYSPARAADAITVGATTSTDARASYSNYGTCLDIFAPGSNITSAFYTSDTATASMSGTSMAAPHVAGAAAMFLEKNPWISSTQMADELRNQAASGVVSNPGTGSVNKLVNVGFNPVTFQTSSGYFLRNAGGGGSSVDAVAASAARWERYHLVDLNGGALQDGDAVYLQSDLGYYLVAEGGGGGELNADRSTPSIWETFTLLKLNGPGPIVDGDQVALRTYSGNYVVAEGNGGGDANADRTAIGPWETFVFGTPWWW
jgi:aqualysin 1